MECFYQQHGAPLWQTMDEEMEENLTSSINRLCAQNRSKEYVQKMADEFSWYFMLSLKYTWWHLLLAALRTPSIIPILVEVSKLFTLFYFDKFTGLQLRGFLALFLVQVLIGASFLNPNPTINLGFFVV